MSDAPSDLRRTKPGPTPHESDSAQNGGSSPAQKIASSTADEPTIITGRTPIPSPAGSEAISRILEGRVMPGDRLGSYELIEFVGGGGMGRVFRALDAQLGRSVALKILPPELAADPDALQRFQNEAQSAARLDHDNIARVYYVGEDRGVPYIAFEFIEGENLRRLVQENGPLPLDEAVSYTLQIAEALAHADARAVVHRDVKPANVLITPEGRVKLIDMGLARLRQVDPAAADLTASGVTLGTFDYISPEQARDPRNADIRSDIYSLGCTFFFMLTGRPPFPEGTVLQKLLQHQGDQPPDIREFRPELPVEAGQVLRKMLEKDPERRYPNPAELIAELLGLANQIGLRPMSPGSRIWLVPQPSPVSFFHRHLPWIAPVAALVCAVALLDWFSYRSADRSNPPPTAAPVSEQSPTAPRSTKSIGLDRPSPPPSESSGAKQRVELESPDKSADRVPAQPANSPATSGIRPDRSADQASATAQPFPSQSRLLIVGESAQGADQYASLAAACAAARNGDVIELQFNGPREDRPVKISNLSLTIRAGSGYRPIVVFRPTDADPVVYPRSMFTLAGGQITFVDLAAELQVPREVPAESWTLIETLGGEQVRLERCVLTVRNASDHGFTYHQDAAFFRARPAADIEKEVGSIAAATPLATFELIDCVARGEANLLRIEDLQPVHLTWDNGLLISTERLLSADGGPIAPRPDETWRIELQRMTVVAHGGLCRLGCSAANPYQLTTQIAAAESILTTASGMPQIEQEGVDDVDACRQRFSWSGNRNLYEDVEVFWIVRNRDPETPPDVMTFDAWKTYWGPSREIDPQVEPQPWKSLPDAERPLHAQGPADYTLDDAMFDADPSERPGCRIDRLPQLPPEAAQIRNRPPSVRGIGAVRGFDAG